MMHGHAKDIDDDYYDDNSEVEMNEYDHDYV